MPEKESVAPLRLTPEKVACSEEMPEALLDTEASRLAMSASFDVMADVLEVASPWTAAMSLAFVAMSAWLVPIAIAFAAMSD